MKRILLLFALISLFAMAACHSNEKTESTDSATQNEENTGDAIEKDRLKAEQEMMTQDASANTSDTTEKVE